MRKFWCVLGTVLLISFLFTLPVLAAEEAAAPETHAWWEVWRQIDVEGLKAWFEVEVMPHLASVSVILGVALAELLPALRGLIKAKNAFGRVAADVDTYTKSKKEYDARMEELQKRQIAETESSARRSHGMSVHLVRARRGSPPCFATPRTLPPRPSAWSASA